MKILKIKEHKDGSATFYYEVSKKDKEIIKRILGIKRLNKKRINKFVKDSLINPIHKET